MAASVGCSGQATAETVLGETALGETGVTGTTTGTGGVPVTLMVLARVTVIGALIPLLGDIGS